MKPWLLVVLAVGGLCLTGSCGLLFLGLIAADNGEASVATGTGSHDCTSNVDGWDARIGERGVVLSKGDVIAELPWSFAYTDELRADDLNPWRAVLGDRYEPGPMERGRYGDPRLAGPATERSTGRTVYVAFVPGALNGVASPVAIVSANPEVLRAYPDGSSIGALESLNRFPLSCAALEGTWKSGFATAVERYAASTGQYRGVESVAAWRELTLEGGSYRRVSSAMLNGSFFKRSDSGSWSADHWSLTLEPEGSEAIGFNATLVAVQRGYLLRLQNKQFPADVEEFARTE